MHPSSDDIEDELSLVAHEVQHLCATLKRLDNGLRLEPGSQDEWELRTLCASAIEKIYTGCQGVMTRLAAELDGEKISKDGNWHRALLDRMRQPFRAREAILKHETYLLLDRMRAFRHRERNTYGFALDTEIVLERAHEVIRAFEKFANDIRRGLPT